MPGCGAPASQARVQSASARSGSGPSRSTTRRAAGAVSSSQAVAPAQVAVRRRARAAPTSRSRTCPTGGGGGAVVQVELAEEAEVDVHEPLLGELDEQVLAPRLGGRPARCRRAARADSANRPCGLLTATVRPAKCSRTAVARRWRVCPSGISAEPAGPVPERGLRAAAGGCRSSRSRRACRSGGRAAPRRCRRWRGRPRRSGSCPRRVCIRPPTETTLASLCSRARTAVSSLHTSAARTPLTLLAAICSPLPEPPITTPRLCRRPASRRRRPRPRAGRRPGSRRGRRRRTGRGRRPRSRGRRAS